MREFQAGRVMAEFKCFLHMNLLSRKNAEVRSRIDAKLEQSKDVTPQQESEERERIVKLKPEKVKRKDCFRVKQRQKVRIKIVFC